MNATPLSLEIEELEPMEAPNDVADLALGVAVGIGIGLIIVGIT